MQAKRATFTGKLKKSVFRFKEMLFEPFMERNASLPIEDIDGEGSSRNGEARDVPKEIRKLLSVHSGGSDNKLEIGSSWDNGAEQAKKYVGVQWAFMGFIHDDGAVVI